MPTSNLASPGIFAGIGDDPEDPRDLPRPPLDQPLVPRRILIVEDEALIRLDIEAELVDAGYIVVGSVASADAAVAQAGATQPDLVLMDVRILGARDGVDAAIEIWQRYRIKSLFVSANLDDATRQRAAAAEPWGFLPKPFGTRQLLAAIGRPN